MTADEYRDWLVKHGIVIFMSSRAMADLRYVERALPANLKTAVSCGRFQHGRDAALILPDTETVTSLLRELKREISGLSSLERRWLIEEIDVALNQGGKWMTGPFTAKPGTLFHVKRGKQPKANQITLTPRIPESISVGNENGTTPRVCLCRDLGGCFAAIYLETGNRFSIWTNTNSARYFVPNKKLVYDAEATGEVWSLDEIEMTRCQAAKDALLEALASSVKGPVSPKKLPAVKALRHRITKELKRQEAVKCR